MRRRLFTVVVGVVSLLALPAAGAYLLRSESPPLPPARVTVSPTGARSPLFNLTMTQADIQWDAPRPRGRFTASESQSGAAFAPDVLDAIDVKGRHFGGFGVACAPHSATLVHCTFSYPDARDHAPWATVEFRLVPPGAKKPITLWVHPG